MKHSQSDSQLLLRSETSGDYLQIAELLDAAFLGTAESQLVERIRETPDYINALTLIAKRENRVVGYIMLSYVTLGTEKDSSRVLSLGPVAVTPDCQKQGIGGKLIEEAIQRAEQMNEPLIVLLGHATYYPRFGFERASLYNIHPPVPWRDENYMIRKLTNFSPTLQGTITYSPAWRLS